MAKFRRARLGDQVRLELADLIRGNVRDPRIGFVTVTEVRMSPDLQYARVYVSILGDPEEREESLRALSRAGGYLRSQVGRRLRVRHVPHLRFVLDETLDTSERLADLLRQTGDLDDE